MSRWFATRVKDPMLRLLKQGVSPRELALSVAVGLVLGVFPALGVTTLMAAAVALRFRLNMVAMQLVNYLAYPLQFALLVPFYRAGERLFDSTSPVRPASEVFEMIRTAPLEAVGQLWTVTWHAAVVWAIFACAAVPLLAWIFSALFIRLSLSSTKEA